MQGADSGKLPDNKEVPLKVMVEINRHFPYNRGTYQHTSMINENKILKAIIGFAGMLALIVFAR